MILIAILIAAILIETLKAGPSAWFELLQVLFFPGVTWHYWLALLPVMHIIEEHICGFRHYFNYEVMLSSRGDRPVRVWEAILKDELGLAAALVTLCILSANRPWLLSVFTGFIAADAAQHLIYSFRDRDYTPGVFTALIFYVPAALLILFKQPIHWLALLAGAAALAGNFSIALLRRKFF
jgi:hypothetical protein